MPSRFNFFRPNNNWPNSKCAPESKRKVSEKSYKSSQGSLEFKLTVHVQVGVVFSVLRFRFSGSWLLKLHFKPQCRVHDGGNCAPDWRAYTVSSVSIKDMRKRAANKRVQLWPDKPTPCKRKADMHSSRLQQCFVKNKRYRQLMSRKGWARGQGMTL